MSQNIRAIAVHQDLTRESDGEVKEGKSCGEKVSLLDHIDMSRSSQ